MTPLAEVEVLITIPAASAAFSSGWRGWEVRCTSTWEWGISTLGWTLFQIVVWRLLKKMSIDVAAIRAFLEANELRAQGQGVMEPAHPPGGPQNARPIRAAGNVMQEAAVEAPRPLGPKMLDGLPGSPTLSVLPSTTLAGPPYTTWPRRPMGPEMLGGSHPGQ